MLDRADPTLRQRTSALAPTRIAAQQRHRTKYAFLHDGGVADDTGAPPSDGPSGDGLHSPKGSPHSAHGSAHRRRGDICCEECTAQGRAEPASVTCGKCGMLCAKCDLEYHRLLLNREHHRIPLRSHAQLVVLKEPLRTDSPLSSPRHAAHPHPATGSVPPAAMGHPLRPTGRGRGGGDEDYGASG